MFVHLTFTSSLVSVQSSSNTQVSALFLVTAVDPFGRIIIVSWCCLLEACVIAVVLVLRSLSMSKFVVDVCRR